MCLHFQALPEKAPPMISHEEALFCPATHHSTVTCSKPPEPLCFLFFHAGEGQDHLKKIAVQVDIEFSVLKLRQIFGNGEAKAAAFRASRHISPDKAFRQFIRIDVQGLCGDVLHGENRRFLSVLLLFRQIQIYSGSFQRIFIDVSEQIFHHAPDSPAVRLDINRPFRHNRNDLKTFLFHFLHEFANRLIDQLHKIDALQLKGNISDSEKEGMLEEMKSKKAVEWLVANAKEA